MKIKLITGHSKNIIAFLFATSLLTYPTLASAYIGPGLGLGTIATVLGVVLGLLMLVIGVIWYPVKRLIRRIRSKK